MKTDGAFINALAQAIANCSLYSAEHELVEKAIADALSSLAEIPGEQLEIMVVEGELIVNKARLKGADLHGRGIVKRLEKRGITWVHFKKGVPPLEMKGFVADTADPARELRTWSHIGVGAIGVRVGAPAEGVHGAADLSAFTSEQIENLKDIYAGVSPFKKLKIAGLEEIVASFVVAIRQEADVLRMINPVKAYSEYTYTHATNVALLSMSLAGSLGIGDELLHEVGVAALMHDVGKLFISKEVLHKKGKLEKEEFDEMMRHPLFGAHYLAGTKDLTHMATLAAFEHHRKFDGSGYPQLKTGEKGQHICSQVVAIADFFDALRSNRPYREGWDVKRILSLMKENVARDFNSFLLANFEVILLKSFSLQPGSQPPETEDKSVPSRDKQ